MATEPAGSSGGPLERAGDGTGLDATGESSGDASFDLNLAVSQLASNSTDVRIMLKVLVSDLSGALGNRISVERAGRFRKSDEIKSVRITLGDDTLEAVADGGGGVRCTIGHSSGGIRIRSEQVGMDVWLTRLLTTLQAEAATSEQTRLALEQIVIGGPS